MSERQLYTCPVERLAREQNRLWKAYSTLEEIEVDQKPRFNNPIFDQMTVIDHKIDAAEEIASWERAQSITGAAFQLMLAMRDVSTINDFEVDDTETARLCARAKRNLFSALTVLKPEIEGLDTIMETYASPRLDTVQSVQAALREAH